MRRLLLLAGAIVLVDTMFFAAITPLLPFYADRLGLSKGAAGVLAGAYPAGALLAALPGGWVAARVGVRPTVLAGLGLLAASTLAFGLAERLVLLDVSRFAQGVASAFSWAGAFAWLVAAAPRERRGEVIGAAFSAAIVGALLGPVLGGIARGLGPAPTFAAVALLAVALMGWAAVTPSPGPAGAPSLRALGRALRRPAVALGLWLLVLVGLLFGVFDVLAPLALDALGAGALVVTLTFLVASAMNAAAGPLIGRLADRRGPLGPAMLGLGGSAALAAVLPLPGTVAALVPVVVVAAVAFGTLFVPGMTLLSAGAEASGVDQALGFALMNLGWGLGQLAGSAGGGRLAQAAGDGAPYALLAGLSLATLVALRRRRALVTTAPRPPGTPRSA